MFSSKITEDIYWIGVNDRTTDLFEGFWPIPYGVSLNSYLIKDEKNVIVDLVKATKTEYLIALTKLIDPKDIDYVVINHMEPDHTGIIKLFKQVAPNAKFIGNIKTAKMLESFYGITDDVIIVEDGEELSIGKRTLQFHLAPMVHWPETMVTYEKLSKILFAGDAFGGYGALKGCIFDDEILVEDKPFFEKESLRYYANIVAKYSKNVLRAINKLSALEIDIICPTHGLIWHDKPEEIVNLYVKWAKYQQEAELGVTVIYASMYGNTEAIMNAIVEGIAKVGIPIQIFDAARTHPSWILPELYSHRGVIIGSPTYEAEIFMPVQVVLDLAKRKRMYNKKVALFGSYGWHGGAIKQLKSYSEDLKWEVHSTFDFEGGPTKEDLIKAVNFGENFAKSLKE